jgi:hypothetical protein
MFLQKREHALIDPELRVFLVDAVPLTAERDPLVGLACRIERGSIQARAALTSEA